MATSLFVGNLSYGTSEAKLKEAFAEYGASAVRIIEGRGFGFVEVDPDKASDAIEAMHEKELDGRKINVNEARPREDRGGGGGGGYKSGGGGGGNRGGGGGGYGNNRGGGGRTGGKRGNNRSSW